MILVAVFYCFVTLSLPQMVATRCSPEQNDPSSIVPLPPSLKPLAGLKLLEFNGKQLFLDCELLICSIPTPINYTWYQAKERDEQGERLTNTHKNKDEYYYLDGSYLYIDNGMLEAWDEISGFYWCEAKNDKGVATSNKVEVIASKTVTTKEALPETIIKSGESVHIKMYRDPITDDDMPVNVFYSVNFLSSDDKILKPGEDLTGKAGRFVIGDDYDLYVLEAISSDSAKFQQIQTYYSTSTKLRMRDESKLTVEHIPYDGPPQTGFFDGYTDYVFVEGKLSYFNCIPKKVVKVTFKKDGKEIEDLRENEDDDVFRSRYGLWFKKADASHTGTYTCHLEGDDAIFTKTVKVVGPPKITCNFESFIIETPVRPINMNCNVTSDFLQLNEPDLYFNNQPFDEVINKSDSFEKTVDKISNGYKIKVSSKAANQDHDQGVFRFSERAERAPTRADVLVKLGYNENEFYKIQFNGFRILQFQSRREVPLLKVF